MSKPALIRKITKTLRAMPKKRLAVLCYNITKSKLPRLRKSVKIRAAPLELSRRQYLKKGSTRLNPQWATRPKKKRKFSRKQLAAQRLFAKRARAGTLRR